MFHSDMGVIIGYDKNCHKISGCTGEYHSLDGTKSLNPVATKFNSDVGKSFTPIKGNPVLILSNGMIKSVTLEAAFINSMPCRSLQVKVLPIECGMNYGDLEKFDAHKVICSMQCVKKTHVV